ncbi:MAG: hypothetical protein ABI557_13965 [Aureliella sp.]
MTSVLDREVSAEMVHMSFVDATQESAIDFHHFPAARRSLLPEDMGSGMAWGDYDGDGTFTDVPEQAGVDEWITAVRWGWRFVTTKRMVILTCSSRIG